MGSTVVPGARLEWTRAGDGHPLVLVHGFTGSALDWVDVVGALARDRAVITYDHRGHGASTNTGDATTYTFERLVDDLTVLVDDLGLATFDLLGHSMGGVVAMRYALAHPERVRSLVLMDTAAGAQGGALDFMRAGIELVRARGMEGLIDVVAGDPGEGDDDPPRERLRTKLASMDPVAFVALGEELLTYPSLVHELAGVEVPTSVVVGANDVGLRPAADELAATIPGAVLEVIPDAAHSPQDENREAWLGAVERHLARVG